MSTKKCAKCEKIVYPTELLNCLDKYWHKGCFKCQSCNMTLNMKNYKGYDKLPYCNAHYPTTKHTAVAETPELRRIAANTKIQSNIKYHEDFEKNKGTKISVADDPETMRVRKNMEHVSNAVYHNEYQKKQNMEMMRPQEYDSVNVRRKQPGSISDYDPTDTSQSYNTNTGTPYSAKHQSTKVFDSRTGADQNYNARHYSSGSTSSMENGSSQRRVGSISDYDPMNERYGSITGQYTSGKDTAEREQSPPPPLESAQQDDSGFVADDDALPEKKEPLTTLPEREISSQSSESDVAPPLPKSEIPKHLLEDDTPPPVPQSEVPPLSPQDDTTPPLPQSEVPSFSPQDDTPPPLPQSEVPSLSPQDDAPPPVPECDIPALEMDVGNTAQQEDMSSYSTGENFDSSKGFVEQEIHGGQPQQYHQPPPQQYNPPPQQYNPQPQQYNPQPQSYQQPRAPGRPESSGPMYRAMYDYNAADSDEVSFMEGDIIINTQIIDDGWMEGTVRRTGLSGMLPSNYVERA